MADQDYSRSDARSASPDSARGREGEVREARPENATRDPEAAARQEQVQRDSDALRESARRVEASTPANVRDRSVQDITRDIERNTDRTRDTGADRGTDRS
jgi:hypothetical protein